MFSFVFLITFLPPADDCERGLEPLKTYKASINKSLASLAQQVVYRDP
jgi:hypothetical protein